MNAEQGMTDKAILAALGSRIRQRRLSANVTQRQAAQRAGISRLTVGALERGAPSSLTTLVQVLRALDCLDELASFLPETGPSPLQLAKLRGRQRRRARQSSAHPPAEGDR